MKIKLLIKNIVILATLEDNPSSRDLYDQLPLKVKFEDYASNEKIFYPPKKLTTKGAPEGYQPKVGDVTYYAPWGDVAIFYKDFSYSKGLIKLGRLTSQTSELLKLEGEVEIQKAE